MVHKAILWSIMCIISTSEYKLSEFLWICCCVKYNVRGTTANLRCRISTGDRCAFVITYRLHQSPGLCLRGWCSRQAQYSRIIRFSRWMYVFQIRIGYGRRDAKLKIFSTQLWRGRWKRISCQRRTQRRNTNN